MRYPVNIEKIEGEYVATISHPEGRFQGACTGTTRKDAVAHLGKLIVAMISIAIKDGDEIPAPAECDAATLSAKVELYKEMKTKGIRKADMARSMHVNQKQVDRILDPAHRSTLSQLEAAAESLGKHFDLRLV